MIKNQTTTHKILIITLLLGLFVLLTSVSGVHASQNVYVNATGGNDSNDGSSEHPYQTIDQAMKNVDENGTVKIADGTYKGKGNTNLTISKNMKIIGQHQKKTIINGEGTNWIFKVSKGVNVTILNLTLTNGTAKNGGAIYNEGTCNVRDCIFTGNTATSGGAIYNYYSITNLSYCTFTGNKATDSGGAIHNYYSITNLSYCTFTGNTATNGGAFDNMGTCKMHNCAFTGNTATYGGAIDNFGHSIANLNVNNCTFQNNKATNGGAIFNSNNCTCNVSSCTFTGNTATTGGAFDNMGTCTIHFNRFVNNTATNGNAIYCIGGTVDVRYNWWGSNTNPKNITNLIAGKVDNVDSGSWLVLSITPRKNSIDAGGKTVVTVDLLHDCNGVYHDPANGHVPDGTVVTFSASNGTLNPITTELVNGSAVTTLTAKSEGKSIIQATIDNQTVLTEVTVNPVKPTPVDPVKPAPVKPDTPNSNDNGTQQGTVHAASTMGLQKTGIPLNWLLLGLIMVFGAFGMRRK